jgi:hypothetical protein
VGAPGGGTAGFKYGACGGERGLCVSMLAIESRSLCVTVRAGGGRFDRSSVRPASFGR